MKFSIIHFCALIFLFSISIYLYIFLKPITPDRPIHSDGQGYYAYLPSILLNREVNVSNPDKYETTRSILQYPAFNRWPETGNYLNKYPMGEAILLLPFFLFVTFLSMLLGFPVDGYNPIYQHLVGLSASLYLSFGIYFLFQFYRSYFSKIVSLFIIIILLFATNLLHYSTYDSIFSHVYSFFSISLTLYLIDKWHKRPNSLKFSLLLGFSIGINFLIRNTHVIIILFFLLYKVYNKKALKLKIDLLKKNQKNVVVLFLIAFLTIIPQFIYYKIVTNRWFVFSYLNEGFNWLNPAWYGVLFSPRKGLIFWTPVFLLTFPSILLFKKMKPWFIAAVILIGIQIYLIASWHQWWFGDSFGHRGFIDIYPVLGLFLGAGLTYLLQRKVTKYLTAIFVVFSIILNNFLMIRYWQKILPRDHTTWERYIHTLTNQDR